MVNATAAASSASTMGKEVTDEFAENMMNLALLNPPQWGWSCVGGVVDLQTPHVVGSQETSVFILAVVLTNLMPG